MRYITFITLLLVGCTTYYPTVITEKITVDKDGNETVISRTEKVVTPTHIPVAVPSTIFGHAFPWVPQYYCGPYYMGYGRFNGYLARPWGRGWYGGGGCGPFRGSYVGGRVRFGVRGYVR